MAGELFRSLGTDEEPKQGWGRLDTSKAHSADWASTPIQFWSAGEDTPIPEIAAPQYIRGRVQNADGIGIARTVIAIDRKNGVVAGITTSLFDGTFEIRPKTRERVALLALPLDGENINAVVLDNILPVPG